MIQKFKEVKEAEKSTIGITQKFVQDGIRQKTTGENKTIGEKETEKDERGN